MNQTSPVRRATGGHPARSLTPAVLAAVIVAGTAACDSSDTSSRGTANGTRTVSPEPAASPKVTESPRTQQEFAASVSAEAERSRQKAVTTLKGVKGKGDAVKDISVNGLAVEPSEQFRSALVRVTNPTGDRHANSRKAAGVKTFPRIAQAERG